MFNVLVFTQTEHTYHVRTQTAERPINDILVGDELIGRPSDKSSSIIGAMASHELHCVEAALSY